MQRVPWEYLHADEHFLAAKFSLTRGLPPAQRIGWEQTEITADALAVLVVASDPLVYPDGAPVVALNVARERANVTRAFAAAHTPYHVTFVKPPTLDELHKALAPSPTAAGTRLVHFIGHGIATPEGARLAFQDRCGVAHSVTAEEFIAPARGRVLLVFLNACQTALSLDTPISNLAYALARAGVPYALGMQFSVPEIVALRLSEFFYTFLARGNSVEESLLQARLALARDEDLARVPTPDGGAADARAFALGIPVLYTALTSPLPPLRLGEGHAVVDDFHPRAEFDAPLAPPQKFRGRVQELATLGRLFERGCATDAEVDAAFRREGRPPGGARVVVLRGEGGIGKRTLARRAAEHFDWRFPDGILGLSFEILPSRERLVNRLGKWLWGEAFDKLDESAREGAAADELRARRALLILDNYETLEEALDAGDSHAPALASFIAHIAGGETTLLITSRRQISELVGRELLLDGLDDEAGRELFWDFAAQRRREVDESFAAEVVAHVGGHPLALELLAKAYATTEQTFPDFVRGLSAHLAQARSRYKIAPRQQTLAGCFDYSFQFLPPEAQALFPKLRLFAAPFLADAAAEIFGAREARRTLNVLQQKSMIRAMSPFGEGGLQGGEDVLLYFLHPTARWYAEQVGKETGKQVDKETGKQVDREVGARYGEWYARLARAAYQSFAGKTDVRMVQLARVSMADLLQAREFLDAEARVWHSFRIAYLFQTFGALSEGLQALAARRRNPFSRRKRVSDAAIFSGNRRLSDRLLDEALVIAETNKLDKPKSSILFEMARLFVTRGDLDRAMQLYQQSLAILEQLGDLQGKATTLAMLAQLLAARGQNEAALAALLESLQVLLKPRASS